MRKVAWPTRAEVVRYSIIVTVCVIVYMVYVGGIDYVAWSQLLEIWFYEMSDNEETSNAASSAADDGWSTADDAIADDR